MCQTLCLALGAQPHTATIYIFLEAMHKPSKQLIPALCLLPEVPVVSPQGDLDGFSFAYLYLETGKLSPREEWLQRMRYNCL